MEKDTLSRIEAFRMICDDEDKVRDYTKMANMRQRIMDNNGITLEDFNELCNIIGFDSEMAESIKIGFEKQGKILDSYKEQEAPQR